ncbi:MAG TPA: FkbM family methyltransferase [Acidimicrobiales bacterium]|jgi:FkbM family methyltransferase|nr:FkbM family methyltransferase [Acidimicrobiales bacterium]
MALGRRALRARGIEVVAAERASLLPLHLSRLFAQEKIDHVLDVGAQIGRYAVSLRDMGYRGEIWSFEPVSISHEVLAEKAASDPLWRVFNLALGAEAGEASINVAMGSDFSSFLSPTEMALSAPHLRAVARARTENVRVATLDEIFEREPALRDRRIHLKLDTQGFDLEVLEGAATLMPFVRSMQTEVSLQPVYEGMPDFTESLAVVASLGFAVSGFFPVAVNPDLSVIELDCVAVRRR